MLTVNDFNNFTRNNVKSNSCRGFEISNSNNNTVYTNTIEGNYYHNIEIKNSVGNKILENSVKSAFLVGNDGINLQNSNYTTIMGNNVSNTIINM